MAKKKLLFRSHLRKAVNWALKVWSTVSAKWGSCTSVWGG